MSENMKRVKGIRFMTKDDLRLVIAGAAPDCEDDEIPVDGVCIPIELYVAGDGRLPGGGMDNCHTN